MILHKEQQKQLLSLLLPICCVLFFNNKHNNNLLVVSFKIIPSKVIKSTTLCDLSDPLAKDSYFKTSFYPPNNFHNYGKGPSVRYMIGGTSNKKEEWSSYVMADQSSYLQRNDDSNREVMMEPGRRFDSMKQMDALHEVGNEDNLRRLWRSKRDKKVPQDDDYLTSSLSFHDNNMVDRTPPKRMGYTTEEPGRRFDAVKLSDDIKEVDNKNKVLRSLYEQTRENNDPQPGRRFDAVKLSDDIHQVDNKNKVLRSLYKQTRENNYNSGSSASFSQQSDINSFGRSTKNKKEGSRRFDNTRRNNDRIEDINNKNNAKNRRRSEPRSEQLSQRILRAMDPYDPYYEQQEEPFDSTFDSMNSNHRHDRNIKEYEGRASDLETRLESFKDYASSSKRQQQDPFEVRGPQNPYKQQQRDDYDDDYYLYDNDRNEDDNMKDLEEDIFKQRDLKDIFKSPNPYKQNIRHENNQDIHNTATATNNIPTSEQRDDYDDDYYLYDNDRNEDDNMRDLGEDIFKQRDLKDIFKSPNPYNQNIRHENNQDIHNTATATNNIPTSATTTTDIENDDDDDMGIENNIDNDDNFENRLNQMELRLNGLLDKLENRF